ncbi:MAG: hypothetical protein JJE46_07880 [Acidimicrobiia bacterium]|nr:hypothetical protein [Acidimicrobiia bacterium]
MILPDGSVPASDVIMLHHAVWLNLSAPDMTVPSIPERFFATGEEKSELTLPTGFGYPYSPSDQWLLNYMLHVLVDQSFDVRVTYDLDFVPAVGRVKLRSVRPIWMDVDNGSNYPVFDAVAGAGVNGRYTYPAMANNPYGNGPKKNEYTVPTGGVIVQTMGHLHAGGLSTELFVTRQLRRGPKTGRLFKSDAVYYEPGGPVSWDVSMTATPATWKVHVRPGDVLSLQATYDTSDWSWFESMGINIAWFAPGGGGKGTFNPAVDVPGAVTHGHLAENDNHGGGVDLGLPDPATLPNGAATSAVTIQNFEYGATDLDFLPQIPTVTQGSSITFTNRDTPANGFGIAHTITACRLPCNKSTGIAFPTANAPITFDSGQLGNFGQPTLGTRTWSTPANLPTGDYTFFCRVHPFMRGAFRVTQ